MTPLRQRMLEDMSLPNFSPETQRSSIDGDEEALDLFGKLDRATPNSSVENPPHHIDTPLETHSQGKSPIRSHIFAPNRSSNPHSSQDPIAV